MPPSMRPQTGARTRGFFDGFTAPEGQPDRSAPVRDTSLAQPGGGSGSGIPLDIYGQGSPAVARDLKMDPITSNEMDGYKVARTIGTSLLGPIGTGLFSAAEYGFGSNGYNPAVDSALRNDAMVANTYNAGRVEQAFPDSTIGQRAETALATSKMGKYLGAQSNFITLTDGTVMRSDGEMSLPPQVEGPAGVEESRDGGGTYGSGRSGGGGYESGRQASGATVGGPIGPSSISTTNLGSLDGGSGGGYGNQGNGGYGGDTGGYGGSYGSGSVGGFADGGMVGLTGPRLNDAPQNLTQMGFADGGGVGMGSNMGPEQLQQQINQMVRNPQFKQVAQQAVGNAMASGELTPKELVTLGRIAEAAMHNPGLYPQLRQFASQNGMTPLPPSYDPRLVVVLIAASKIMGATQPGQVPPMDQAQMENPNGMANGGFLRGPGTGRSDSIGTVEESTGKPVKVANGEYVIPAHVVAAKGKDFFDKMLRQYAQLTPQE